MDASLATAEAGTLLSVFASGKAALCGAKTVAGEKSESRDYKEGGWVYTERNPGAQEGFRGSLPV